MTDCSTYAWVPRGPKQMETIQAEAQLDKDVLHDFGYVKRNNWMGFLFLHFWFLNWRGKNPVFIAVSSIYLDSIAFAINPTLQMNQLMLELIKYM